MSYKIIGADQKEYGPVTFDLLKQWIEQGRANAQTVAQAEGTTEWKTLDSFPEFAPFFAAKPPYVPPGDNTHTDPVALASEILARDYTLDIGSCLSRAWALVKSDFWPIIGVSALIWLIICATGSTIGIIVHGPLLGGLYWYNLKRIRGQSAALSDAFAGFQMFLPLFLACLVSSVLLIIAFFCLIIPFIYLAIAWLFVYALIIDKKIAFWPALELSRKVVSKHWWSFFGFMIVCTLLNLAGFLAFCVGVFVTVPVTMIAFTYAYEDIFRASGTPASQP